MASSHRVGEPVFAFAAVAFLLVGTSVGVGNAWLSLSGGHAIPTPVSSERTPRGAKVTFYEFVVDGRTYSTNASLDDPKPVVDYLRQAPRVARLQSEAHMGYFIAVFLDLLGFGAVMAYQEAKQAEP